jgi:hypothetical protein
MTSIEDQPLTEELLERLLESSSPDAYLSEVGPGDCELSELLLTLAREKGLTRAAAIAGSGLSAPYGYQLFTGARHPNRDAAIMISFGLRCSLVETQRLLKSAGLSELWCKRRRDAIIIYCVSHGYSRARCDDELFRLGEETLLKVAPGDRAARAEKGAPRGNGTSLGN